MFKYGCAVLVGIAVAVAAFWYLTTRPAGQSVGANVSKSISSVVDSFKVEDIKEELARTGTVVREKARQAGDAISDAASNARITAAIKGKLLTDPELPSFQISVSTTDGTVTISGKVSSAEAVTRAVGLAFHTEGVHKVFSTLQISTEKK